VRISPLRSDHSAGAAYEDAAAKTDAGDDERRGEIKRLRPEQRIMAISGSARLGGTDFLLRAKELGADGVLPKPFLAEELIGKVEACLAKE
jgi:hypothetical protein